MHKGHDIDTAAGRCYFHMLKYTNEGMLRSHTIVVRSRQVTRGFLIRARVDYSGKRLVVLSYLPPGGPRRHGHLATLFRIDLRDPISLVGPRIDLPLPDGMSKSIERKTKDPAMPEPHRNGIIRQLLHGLDFDIAPPQGSTGVHVAHVLLANTVYTFSLETGQQLMEPLMPLAAQKRSGTLSCIRCVAKFDVQAGHHRDPFAAPPQEHEDPDTASSYEHLVICTARDVPSVFMYSIEPYGGHRVAPLTPNPSQGSSRMPSRGGLEEQAALVSAAHERAQTRQLQLARGPEARASATARSGTNNGPVG